MKKLVLSLAFVGLGTFAMAQQTRTMPPQKTPEEMQAKMQQRDAVRLEHMRQTLNLTPAQVTQIQAMQDKHNRMRAQEKLQNQQLRKDKMEQMKAVKLEKDNELRAILTPDQYQKWEAERKQKMQQGKARYKMAPKGEISAKPLR